MVRDSIIGGTETSREPAARTTVTGRVHTGEGLGSWHGPTAIVFILAAGILVAFRLHAFSLPLETDECNYAYIAGRLLAGDKLYVDVWDHQPPGVFVLFAGATAVFGQQDYVYRGLAMAASLASLGLIASLVHRSYGRFAAGVAALAFAVVSSDPSTAGDGCNREIYMNLFGLAAVSLLARAGTTRRSVLLAGLLFGVSSAFKTVAAAQWVTFALWMATGGFASRGRVGSGSMTPSVDEPLPGGHGSVREPFLTRARRGCLCAAWFAVGPGAVWLCLLLYFAATDRGQAFVEAVFEYNVGYSRVFAGWQDRFIVRFVQPRFDVFTSAWPLWVAAFPAILIVANRERRRRWAEIHGNAGGQDDPRREYEEAAAHGSRGPLPDGRGSDGRRGVGWTIPTLGDRRWCADGPILVYCLGSYLAVCLPGLFWPHYYHLLVPGFVLVCAAGCGLLPRASRSEARPLRREWARLLVVVGSLLALVGFEWHHYLSVPLGDIVLPHPVYRYRQRWAQAHGQRVAALTNPDDTIFVWGQDAGIYYYAGRRAASRYTMVGALLDTATGHAARRETLLTELAARRPRLVLITEREFDELARFLQAHYWQAGPRAVDNKDDNPQIAILRVLMDRQNPIESIDWEWKDRG